MAQSIQGPSLSAQWTDAHAHLADLDNRRLAAIVAEAGDADVVSVINTATDLESCRQVCAQCREHPILKPALGISPFDITTTPPDWQQQLSDMLADPCVVAVGETGVDTSNPRYPPIELQMKFLATHASLAMTFGLPLVVHSRGAESLVARECRARGLTRVLFHCFTGDRNSLDEILSAGYHVSISGILTFPRSTLKEILRNIPLDRLLLETDSPYLAPVPHRGESNRPALVGVTGTFAATVLGMEPSELARNVRCTFDRFFKRHAPEDDGGPSISDKSRPKKNYLSGA